MSVYNFFYINHASVRMQNTVWEQSYIPDHPIPLILGEPGAASQGNAIFSGESPALDVIGLGESQPHSQGSLSSSLEKRKRGWGNPHPSFGIAPPSLL